MMITNKTLKMGGPHPFFNTAAYARTNQLAPGMEGKSNKKKKVNIWEKYITYFSVFSLACTKPSVESVAGWWLLCDCHHQQKAWYRLCLAQYSWSNSVSVLLRELKFASLTCAYVPVSECTPVFTYNNNKTFCLGLRGVLCQMEEGNISKCQGH